MLTKLKQWFLFKVLTLDQRERLTRLIHGKNVIMIIIHDGSTGWPWKYKLQSKRTSKTLFIDPTCRKNKEDACEQGYRIANAFKYIVVKTQCKGE